MKLYICVCYIVKHFAWVTKIRIFAKGLYRKEYYAQSRLMHKTLLLLLLPPLNMYTYRKNIYLFVKYVGFVFDYVTKCTLKFFEKYKSCLFSFFSCFREKKELKIARNLEHIKFFCFFSFHEIFINLFVCNKLCNIGIALALPFMPQSTAKMTVNANISLSTTIKLKTSREFSNFDRVSD